MKPIEFPEANKNLLKPAGMTDAECGSLPVYNDGTESISCWQLTWRERFAALWYGRLWLGVMAGRTQPPVRLWSQKTVFERSVEVIDSAPYLPDFGRGLKG